MRAGPFQRRHSAEPRSAGAISGAPAEHGSALPLGSGFTCPLRVRAGFRHSHSMNSPLRSIHVVAAVITDARGRILLNRRTGNSDMAGLWEFPGGKREPGETSEQALVRELHEELGIDAE